jgi:nitrate reductase NapA
MVGVKEGRVVATHGDTLAEVNRGLNRMKGYFLSKMTVSRHPFCA